MQIFTVRYILEFRKLTSYGLTRPQSIRKSKQISGQTILSSSEDLEFNPNFAKNRDIPVVNFCYLQLYWLNWLYLRHEDFSTKTITNEKSKIKVK